MLINLSMKLIRLGPTNFVMYGLVRFGLVLFFWVGSCWAWSGQDVSGGVRSGHGNKGMNHSQSVPI